MMVMCAASSAAGVHHRKGKGVTMSDVKVRLKKLQDNAIGYDLIDILEWGFDDKGQLQSIVYIGYSIEDEEWGEACFAMLDYYDRCYNYELARSHYFIKDFVLALFKAIRISSFLIFDFAKSFRSIS